MRKGEGRRKINVYPYISNLAGYPATPDSRYPAFRIAGYPAKSVSGASLIFRVFGDYDKVDNSYF